MESRGPVSRAAVNDMRRYLRRADVGGGYVPQVVYPAATSRLWTLFWFAVRRVDDLADRHGPEALESVTTRGEPADFLVALRGFVAEAAPYMDSRRRVLEAYATLAEERRYLARTPPGNARDLFSLWYHKTYVPAYVGYRMLLRRATESEVRLLARLIAAGLQWMDDLCDLEHDLGHGRFWLTREELEILGLEPTPRGLDLRGEHRGAVTDLRERISLRYFLTAYDLALTLAAAEERRRVTLLLEEIFRVYLDGRFRVLGKGEADHWGRLGQVLRRLPGPEGVKYRLLHACNEAYTASGVHPADVDAVRRRLDELGGCPPQLAPEVCLEVMERREEEEDRLWARRDADPHLTLAELAALLDLRPHPVLTAATAGPRPVPSPLAAVARELASGLAESSLAALRGLADRWTSDEIADRGAAGAWVGGLIEGQARFNATLAQASRRAAASWRGGESAEPGSGHVIPSERPLR